VKLLTCRCNTKTVLLCLCNFVCAIKGTTCAVCVQEQSTEGVVWPSDRGRGGDGESCILKCLMILTFPPISFVDEIGENDLARAHDKYGGKIRTRFW
jgi:hypothetical protein